MIGYRARMAESTIEEQATVDTVEEPEPAVQQAPVDLVEELVIADLSIDGMCGVY